MINLAGPISGSKAKCVDYDLECDIEESCWDADADDIADWRLTHDLGKSVVLAEKIAKGSQAVDRILHKITNWTEELFSLPEVWGVTEKLATALYDNGRLTNKKCYQVVKPIQWGAIKDPIWQRRLLSSDDM